MCWIASLGRGRLPRDRWDDPGCGAYHVWGCLACVGWDHLGGGCLACVRWDHLAGGCFSMCSVGSLLRGVLAMCSVGSLGAGVLCHVFGGITWAGVDHFPGITFSRGVLHLLAKCAKRGGFALTVSDPTAKASLGSPNLEVPWASQSRAAYLVAKGSPTCTTPSPERRASSIRAKRRAPLSLLCCGDEQGRVLVSKAARRKEAVVSPGEFGPAACLLFALCVADLPESMNAFAPKLTPQPANNP